jgi:xanthine dehydrogenase accessory factor
MTGVDLSSEARPSVRGGAGDVTSVARRWLDEHGAVAVATVVKTAGSFPVPLGGQLVIGPEQRFEGSVSGGCVEAAVIAEAENVLASGVPKRLPYGVSDETAWGVGLPCGGNIEIFLERLSGDEDKAYLDALTAARAERSLLVVETDLATGARTVHPKLDAFSGDLAAKLAAGASFVEENEDGARFLHALAPTAHLVLIGAVHIAQVLADLARRVGFAVTVVDPRTGFASPLRFAGVTLNTDWPADALAEIKLDAHTALVTLTHEARLDDEALAVALRSPAFYVGALGSRRTQAKRVERLKAAGFTDAELARLDAPVGVAIGAQGPAEIAVSILAGVIKGRRAPLALPPA